MGNQIFATSGGYGKEPAQTIPEKQTDESKALVNLLRKSITMTNL